MMASNNGYVETSVTLYGRPGRYYLLLDYPECDTIFKIEQEYRMEVFNITDTTYDYESFYGDKVVSTKIGCCIEVLKREIRDSHLRVTPWLNNNQH